MDADERIAGRTRDEWARFGFETWVENSVMLRGRGIGWDDRPEPAKEADRVIAERLVREAIRGRGAEVERLTQERDALVQWIEDRYPTAWEQIVAAVLTPPATSPSCPEDDGR